MTRDRTGSYDLATRLGVLALGAGIALPLSGCQVYEPPDEVLHAHGDAGHDEDGGHGGENHDALELAGSCATSVPVVESNPDHREATTEGLGNHLSSLNGCGEAGLRGEDGFFAVDAVAGDRWHVAVEPEEDNLDVAAYLMPVCDGASCDRFVDRCGPGVEEDFTFPVQRAGQYIVGINARAGTGHMSVTAIKLVCGDGMRTHGEACDDGNLEAGDGCSPECRIELSSAVGSEEEPNNWHPEANELLLDGGTGQIVVAGELGGPCDQDHFVLEIAEGQDLRAVMLDGSGEPCTEDHNGLGMMLMDVSAGVSRGMGATGGSGGTCPSIDGGTAFASDLPAGEYHVMLTAPRDTPRFSYRLEVEVRTDLGSAM